MFCFYSLKSFDKVSKILAQLKKVFNFKIPLHLPVAQKIIETNKCQPLFVALRLLTHVAFFDRMV